MIYNNQYNLIYLEIRYNISESWEFAVLLKFISNEPEPGNMLSLCLIFYPNPTFALISYKCYKLCSYKLCVIFWITQITTLALVFGISKLSDYSCLFCCCLTCCSIVNGVWKVIYSFLILFCLNLISITIIIQD